MDASTDATNGFYDTSTIRDEGRRSWPTWRATCWLALLLVLWTPWNQARAFAVQGRSTQEGTVSTVSERDPTPAALTPDEEAWLRAHPVVQVGVFAGDHLPAETWAAGRPEGFAVDYARLLAGRVGLQLVFHPFSDLDAVVEGAAQGKGAPYDLLLAVSVTDEHNVRFDFLRPYGSGKLLLVGRKGDEQIRSASDLQHARIVVERSFHHVITTLASRFPTATLLFADDGRQAMDMVAKGQADAYIGVTSSRTQMLLLGRRSDDLVVLETLDLPPVVVGLAMPHGHPMLLQLLRKAENTVTADEFARLRTRWGLLSDGGAPPPSRELAPDEREWLRSLAPLRLGFEVDRQPYTFLDSQGQFDGLAADYVEILQKELGLRVQLVPANDWNSLRKMVRSGEIDMVAAASPDDLPAQDIIFSRTYEHFPEVIVTHMHGPAIAGPEDLVGRKIAAREQAGLLPRLRMLLPRSQLMPVGSNAEGLEMVASGKADAYIGTLPTIDPLIRDRYVATLRVVGPAGLDQDLAIGVTSKYQRLMPMINRVLVGVTEGRRQAIRSHWLTAQYRYGVPWAWVLIGLFVAATIVGAIGFAYNRLRRALRAQRSAELKLDAQLRFQQALLETIPYPVFVKDAEGRYLAINRAYEAMFGCSRGELLGRTLADARHLRGLDADALHQIDLDVLSHGQDVRRELHIGPMVEDGPARDVLLWLHRFAQGDGLGIGLLGTLVDVTDLREAEARALASEQRLIDTNESLPGVVMRVRYTAEGLSSFDYVSGPTDTLYGMSHDELMQGRRRPFDVMQAEDKPAVEQAIGNLLEGRSAPNVEFRIITHTGKHWVRSSFGQPRSESDGTVSCSIFSVDVSVEKAQAQALAEAKAAADAAVAAKSAFLAMMSHEIRTPMAGVLGMIELLGKTPLDREQLHMLDLVGDSASALLQILDDILDFSRIEAGRLRLEDHPFDLRALADGALGLFAALAQEKGVRLYGTLDWRLAAEHRGDRVRIRQVIINLLSNALKFTEKGYVELHIELLDDASGTQRLRINVTDTGTGISGEQLERLFKPFVQAEASTSRRYGGTGLGLSICRHLAQMMGGEVRLSSTPGFGTQAIFEVTLPIARALRPRPALSGKRALLCTRDIMLERGLSNALSALGMSVIGADARDLSDYENEDVDVYAIDANLPGNGWQVHGARVIHLLAVPDPRSFYMDDGQVMLSGYPLLWRSASEACHAVFGLDVPSKEAVTSVAIRHTQRILVAEDHPINRAVISRQLERLGYPHTMVDNGEEALRALASTHYDLLISDCHMPVLDGYALARRIREAEKGSGRHLPILALSASALPEEVVRCREAGMDEFLAKPVQLATLDSMLASCLANAQPGRVENEAHIDMDGDARLRMLMEVFGSRQQVGNVLRSLVDSARQDLTVLDQALRDGDMQQQHDILHRIHGALRLLGEEAFPSTDADAVTQRQHIEHQLEALEVVIAGLDRSPVTGTQPTG